MWDGSRWQLVSAVLGEIQTPMEKRYHVVCEHKNEFWLAYDPYQDSWQVTAAGSDGNNYNKESQ